MEAQTSQGIRAPWLIRPRSGIFVLLVVIFAALAGIAGSGVANGPDGASAKYFNSVQGNSRALDYGMLAVAISSDVSVLVIVGVVLTVIRRTRKAGMIFLIALVAITVLVMYIKPMVGRPVPPYQFSPSLKLPAGAIEQDSLAPPADSLSFPSAHVAAATALAFIAGQAAYRRSHTVAYALWAFPVISAIARLYLLQHYPTDVIGGLVLGVIISALLSSVMKLDVPFSISQLRGAKAQGTGR